MKAETKHLCFARRHMPPAVESFHRYALNVSRGSGVFYSNERRDAEDFGVSKTTIAKYMDFLEREKWAIRLTKGEKLKRNKLTGTFESIPYKILDHDEFAAQNLGTCRYPEIEKADLPQKLGPDSGSPVQVLGATCPSFSDHLHQFLVPPAPETGAKTVKTDSEEERKERKNKGANPNSSFSVSNSETQTATNADNGQGKTYPENGRKAVLKEYLLWLAETWLDLNLTFNQKKTITTFILTGDHDLPTLKRATHTILDDLNPSNSFDHAGNKLAAGLSDKAAVIRNLNAKAERQKAEIEQLKQQLQLEAAAKEEARNRREAEEAESIKEVFSWLGEEDRPSNSPFLDEAIAG